ncbi:hypothetical protein E2562_023419 [Oryza meyeriana var. granulata]|uniref:Cytokinin dehydrogenase 1 FAD/cytokinin binding domain-containing protein n=1 Tax=Oryza meyeriana var. granulata TaxID=110450 RepID=A0A6G1FB17_9ORYZ|nr:hypothetical protein E2562_023419 [Oryza meyeriana var. granulata]
MYYNKSTATSVDQKLGSVLEQLSFEQGFVFAKDVSYVQFLDHVREEERVLRSIGMWDMLYPWLYLFVPHSRILDFNVGMLKGVFAGANTIGVILMYPMNRDRWDGLATSDVERLEKENEAVLAFCDNEGIGCKQYMPHYASHEGWQRHFGAKRSKVAKLKAMFDPLGILSSGQRIFSSPATTVVSAM